MKGGNGYKFHGRYSKNQAVDARIYYLHRVPGFDSITHTRLLFQTMNIITNLLRVRLTV